MNLGRIIGRVIATRKDERLESKRLLLLQPLRSDNTPFGEPLIAVDSAGAGASERVLWVTGKEASFPFGMDVPVDACIVGILDSESEER
ncbi:MAG: EutN/CcmL family microcompartment protein [Candidatus Coatesbacteria bacterium]|nr:EutN/CcmL family microcompartment protein [Candidatus Coatesbacteria bacterium]